MSDLEKTLRDLMCPCNSCYVSIEYNYKTCRTGKVDCMVYKLMKSISQIDSPKEKASEFIKNYKFT